MNVQAAEMQVSRMLNILKMEFSRFFTNKMMYILLLVYLAFQMFGTFMFTQFETVTPFGSLTVEELNQSQYMQLILSQTPSWVMLYIGIFTVTFYMSEYNHGFYKNYISMENARVQSIIAKILVLGMFTAIMFAVMLLADFTSRAIFFDNMSIGDIDYFLKVLLGQFLLHWAFVVMMLAITVVIKRMIPSMIIAVILGLNVIGALAGVIESLIHDGNFTSYMLINTIITIRDFNDTGELMHVIIVAAVYLIVFAFVAIRVKIKEDLH